MLCSIITSAVLLSPVFNGVLYLVNEDIDKYYNNELNFYKEGALIL